MAFVMALSSYVVRVQKLTPCLSKRCSNGQNKIFTHKNVHVIEVAKEKLTESDYISKSFRKISEDFVCFLLSLRTIMLF